MINFWAKQTTLLREGELGKGHKKTRTTLSFIIAEKARARGEEVYMPDFRHILNFPVQKFKKIFLFGSPLSNRCGQEFRARGTRGGDSEGCRPGPGMGIWIQNRNLGPSVEALRTINWCPCRLEPMCARFRWEPPVPPSPGRWTRPSVPWPCCLDA